MKTSIITVLITISWFNLFGQFKGYYADGSPLEFKITTIKSVEDSLHINVFHTEMIGVFIVGFHNFTDSVAFLLSDKPSTPQAIQAALKTYNHKKYIASISYETDLYSLFSESSIGIPYMKSIFGEPESETDIYNTTSIHWPKYRLKCEFYNRRLNKAILYDVPSGSKTNLLIPFYSVTGEDYTIGFDISIKNSSTKTIKYAYITASFYNDVKDKVGTKTVTGVGPVSPGSNGTWEFEDILYSRTASVAKLDQIKLLYMDGTTKIFTKAQLEILSERTVYERE